MDKITWEWFLLSNELETENNNNERRELQSSELVEETKTRVCYTIEINEVHPLEQEFIDEMDKEIVWQDEAKRTVARLVKNSILWIRPKRWPLGVLFFSGPTWVWKTEIVKCISKVLMWYDNWFVKINCESYQESHSKRQLFWAPPSYVWYKDPTPLDPSIVFWYYDWAKKAWTLHSSINHVPDFSIILFDEFEKAHNDVSQSILWLLDEWKIQFWNWKTWNYKNSIIIFTSNIWQKDIENKNSKKSMWFLGSNEEENQKDNSQLIKDAIKEKFSPEFRWRVDEFVEFESLSKEQVLEIIKIQEEKLNNHYKNYYRNMDLSIKFWQNIIDSILDEWFSQESWARWLLNAFDKNIENRLVNLFTSEKFQEFYYLKSPIEILLDKDWDNFFYKIFVDNNNFSKQKENTKEIVLSSQSKLLTTDGFNLDKLMGLNELMREYISTYNLHIDDNDTDFSNELIEIEKVFHELWFSTWDIKYLKNCSMVDLLSDLTTLWRYDFFEKNKDIFYPITQKVVFKYVENKLVKFIDTNWLDYLKIDDLVDEISLYLSENFFEWKNLNTKQIFEIIYYISKIYKEKYEIEINITNYK